MKRVLRVVSGVWPKDGRLLVHEFPRNDDMVHETAGPASCWCEPEVHIKRFERLVKHQYLRSRVQA